MIQDRQMIWNKKRVITSINEAKQIKLKIHLYKHRVSALLIIQETWYYLEFLTNSLKYVEKDTLIKDILYQLFVKGFTILNKYQTFW